MSLATPQETTRSRWPVAVVAVLALLLPIVIGVLKINALTAWRYTNDLFTFDTMFRETLRGHFGMEFAYGQAFGDHAYLIYLTFLPFKYLLGGKMVFLLVILTPLAFALCGLVLFKCAKDLSDARWATLATVIYFLSVGAVRGPFERVFGFHIDTLSGYVAVAMAALFARHAQTNRGAAAAIAAACVFALLKEEMALLGIIFFLTLLVLGRRDRLHITGLILCTAFFIFELWFMHIVRTPWNRGNDALIGIFFRQVRERGLVPFFFSADKIDYWCNVTALLFVVAICVRLTRRLNPHAAALAVAALAKLAFAWAIPDFYPWTWHNYPALIMLTGAIALQALELRHVPHIARCAATALVAMSLGVFAIREIPFVIEQRRDFTKARDERDRLRPGLLDVLAHVDPLKVSSVPKWTAYECSQTEHRHTFFPHGISASPAGIADVLITRRNEKVAETAAFTLAYQNGLYRVWRRSGFLPGEQESRRQFIERFGRDSVGLSPEKSKKKPSKKKKHH